MSRNNRKVISEKSIPLESKHLLKKKYPYLTDIDIVFSFNKFS